MAGLIPQAFIDDLLQRSDIVEVVARRVPDLKKKGRNHSACCPFHKEKTPSFSVNEDRQFYYCFGCGKGGNAIGFMMEFENLDFPQAVESLARDAGVEVPREQSRAEAQRQSQNKQLLTLLERASKYFQYQLRQHPAKQNAVDYLKSRQLSGEIARDFGIGFAPPGWDNLLKALGDSEEEQAAMERAGLVIEKSGEGEGRRYYDRFRDRIMFPIRNTRGDTLGFGGRVLGDDKPKYLNSPETAVFHKGSELYGLFEAKRAHNKLTRLLLVEGYMDVIALAQHDLRYAVATLGTATSERHLTRLFRLVPEVVFCFDGDEAGRTAAWRALETALSHMQDGRQIRFLFLPEGADPDDYIREQGRDAFLKAVDEAAPLEDFFFDKLTRNLDLDSIEGRARLSNLAQPLLRKLPKGIYARLMQDRLAETLGVSAESLGELLAEPDKTRASPPAAENSPAPYPEAPPGPDAPPGTPYPDSGPGPGREPGFGPAQPQGRRGGAGRGGSDLPRYHRPASIKAIELLLRNPEVALALEADLEPMRQAGDEGRQLLLSLIEMVQRDPHVETYTLMGYCYGTDLGKQLTQLFKGEHITPQEGIEGEFKQIVDSILSDIRHQLEMQKLRETLKSRVAAPKE